MAAQTYIEAYGESDPDRTRELLFESFGENGTYYSPSVALNRDEVLEMASDAHTQGRMTITSDIRVHHQFVTFDWLIEDLDGEPVMSGVDFCVLGDDGRLETVVVFMN